MRAPLYLPEGSTRTWAIWLVDQLLRSGVSAEVPLLDGSSLAVETEDLVQRVIYLRGQWEPSMTATIQALLHPGDCFLDVGAHVGYFSVVAARRVGPSGRVDAFEPNPPLFEVAARNLSLNHIAWATAHETAIGRESGRATLYVGPPANLGISTLSQEAVGAEAGGSARTSPLHAYQVEVAVEPLSCFLSDLYRPTVVKIDAEGLEDRIVESLSPMLSSGLPEVALLVEVTPSWETRSNSAGETWVERFATRHGLEMFEVPDSYGIPTMYCDPARPLVAIERVGRERTDVAMVRGPNLLARIDAVTVRPPQRPRRVRYRGGQAGGSITSRLDQGMPSSAE